MATIPALESLRAFLSPNPNLYYLLQAIRAYPRVEEARNLWRWWKDGTGLELEVIEKDRFEIRKDPDFKKEISWDLWRHAPLATVWEQSSHLLIQTVKEENFRLFFWGHDKRLRHFSWQEGQVSKPSIFTYPIGDLLGIMSDLRLNTSNQHWLRSELDSLAWQQKYHNLYLSLTTEVS